MKNKDKELFLVVTQEVEQSRGWCSANNVGSLDSGMRDGANCLLNGEEVQTVEAFNPPGFSYIDQDPGVSENSTSAGEERKKVVINEDML